MRRIHSFWLGTLLAALLFGAAPVAGEEPGIAVGAKAPDFTLLDQTGAEVSLAEQLAKGPLAIVFYRSADW